MAKVMDLAKLRNKVVRNGFDLSRKNAFTAKVGELLPVFTQEVIPGDKFKINLSSFTRTMPVDTAAYTRIREYYDFFFVPTRLLWRYFPTFVTQMKNSDSASSAVPGSSRITFPEQPYFTTSQLEGWIANARDEGMMNLFGMSRAYTTQKLLEYLDYSHVYLAAATSRADQETEMGHLVSFKLNPFPILAYQKIYYDFFRFSQWEDIEPSCFNVDYLTGMSGQTMQIPVGSFYSELTENTMFELRYANYPKDLFMGLLPRAQYGTESLATGFSGSFNLEGQVDLKNGDGPDTVIGNLNQGTSNPFGLSVLSLRQAEFLQRWKEIAQTGDPDYKSQIEKHFNVTVPDGVSSQCRYLGGSSSTLDINEVVNQNLDTASSKAYIQGKGTGNSNATINFEAHEHGIIMAIYHAVPLLDYQPIGFSALNLKTEPTDYAIPEMDRAGMQIVPIHQLVWPEEATVGVAPDMDLGYAPRYIDYKTAVDTVRGAFLTTLTSWTSPLNKGALLKRLNDNMREYDRWYAANVFKVSPHSLDSIFASEADTTVDTDQFLVNAMFSVDAVRNLDYNGLPY